MDKKFLNKVVDQIVSETKIDYDRKEIVTPLHPIPLTYNSTTHNPLPLTSFFSRHCRDVYGLNEQEIEYVWGVYSDDIRYKIKNNGL